MRERLIELIKESFDKPKYEFYTGGRNCAKGYVSAKTIADYLLDNGVIVTPCKVGDTIWAIFPTWTPMECEVVAIEILSSTVNIETKVVDSDADRIFWPADFGKTVFLTKEEAEAKLKEMESK